MTPPLQQLESLRQSNGDRAHTVMPSQLPVVESPSTGQTRQVQAERSLSFDVRTKLSATTPASSLSLPPQTLLPLLASSSSTPSASVHSAAPSSAPDGSSAAPPAVVLLAEEIPEGIPTPILPKLKSTSFTSHRNAANPGLALGLLQEMQSIVSRWHAELHHIIRQIHDLYAAGPIVDGWLESYTEDTRSAPDLRHADVECLAHFVEKNWVMLEDRASSAPPLQASAGSSAAGYRLCGLKEDGQLWFRHCPPAQVPAVSVAIARHQQLRQLLARKQHLETQLGQISQRLIHLHSEIQL